MEYSFRRVSKQALLLIACFCLSPAHALESSIYNDGSDPLKMYRSAGADKEQEQKLQSCLSEFQSLTLAKGQVMIRLMRELRAISLSADADESAAIAKQDEINKLNNEMAVGRIKMLFRLRSVLNQGQREKLVKLMAQQGETGQMDLR